MKGFILYEGASLLNKDPIVAIVTYNSSNPKTGNMAQLWILRSDISPVDAVKQGLDGAICGSCTHRHNKGGSCYVQPFHAPLSVYKSYKKGNYTRDVELGLLYLKPHKLRLGAYGDPAMLPDHILKLVTDNCRGYTGYTHQWKNKRLRHALKYCQASVDNDQDVELLASIAPSAKYFRVTTDYSTMRSNEVVCLNETKDLTCLECMLCNGNKQNIVIKVHGKKASKFSDIATKINILQLS